jgi:hypothetical protein
MEEVQYISYVCENNCQQYNYYNSGYYPSSCLLFKTQLNSIGLSIPQRKHITSPLRAQHVNVDIGGGVGVLLAADSQSTSTSGYRASLWDP